MGRADVDVPAQSLLLGGAALLLGRASATELAPLAVALAAAVLASKTLVKPPPHATVPAPEDDVPVLKRIDAVGRPSLTTMPLAALAIGAAIGASTRADTMVALGQAAGIVLAWAILRYGPPPLARGIWAAVLGAIPARLAAAGGVDLGSLVLLAIVAILAAVLQAIFARALDAAHREFVPGERAVAVGVLAGALVAGVGSVHVGPVALSGVATAIAALWLAQGGPASAAAGCVALGAVSVAAGAVGPLDLAALAVGGLAAGFASPYSRIVAAVGLVAGEAVVTAPATFTISPGLAGVAAGAALVCAVPVAWWPSPPGVAATGPVLQRWLSERLRRVASAVSEVGASVHESAAAVGVPRPEAAAGVLETTVSAVDDVARAVCSGCSAYTDCWDRKFLRAYRMVDDLLLVAESRPVRRADVGGTGPEEIDCLRPADMARGVNLRAELGVRSTRMAARMGESRSLIASQMEGLAHVLEEMAVSAAMPSSGPPARRVLRYEKAVLTEPRAGRETSGDSYLVRELGDGRLLLALSDGMGSGPRAALQSATAVTLLERLLQAAFPAATAVRTVNATLLLRAPDEAFATLDVILADLTAQTAEFFKLGAPWGYHLNSGGDVEAIGPDAPPAGALADVPVVAVTRDLHPGDELVLCTDGVAMAGARPRWLADFLAGEPDEPASDALTSGGAATSGADDPSDHPDGPDAADPADFSAPAARRAGSGRPAPRRVRARTRAASPGAAATAVPAAARATLPVPPATPRTAEDRAEAILHRALELAGAEHDDMTVIVCRLSSTQG